MTAISASSQLLPYQTWYMDLQNTAKRSVSLAGSVRIIEKICKDYLNKFQVILKPGITSIDGDELSVEWNTKTHYVEIEIIQEKLAWFFRDRSTGEIQGYENLTQVPELLLVCLHRLQHE